MYVPTTIIVFHVCSLSIPGSPAFIVQSPRSKASLFSLKDFEQQVRVLTNVEKNVTSNLTHPIQRDAAYLHAIEELSTQSFQDFLNVD